MTCQDLILFEIIIALAIVLSCLMFVKVRFSSGGSSDYQRGVKFGLGEGVKTTAAMLRKRAAQLELSGSASHLNGQAKEAATIYRAAAREIEDALL